MGQSESSLNSSNNNINSNNNNNNNNNNTSRLDDVEGGNDTPVIVDNDSTINIADNTTNTTLVCAVPTNSVASDGGMNNSNNNNINNNNDSRSSRSTSTNTNTSSYEYILLDDDDEDNNNNNNSNLSKSSRSNGSGSGNVVVYHPPSTTSMIRSNTTTTTTTNPCFGAEHEYETNLGTPIRNNHHHTATTTTTNDNNNNNDNNINTNTKRRLDYFNNVSVTYPGRHGHTTTGSNNSSAVEGTSTTLLSPVSTTSLSTRNNNCSIRKIPSCNTSTSTDRIAVRKTSFEYTLLNTATSAGSTTSNNNINHDDCEVVSFTFQETDPIIRNLTSLPYTATGSTTIPMNRVRAETELTVDNDDDDDTNIENRNTNRNMNCNNDDEVAVLLLYPNNHNNNNNNNINNDNDNDSTSIQSRRRLSSRSNRSRRNSYGYINNSSNSYCNYDPPYAAVRNNNNNNNNNRTRRMMMIGHNNYPELNGLNYLNAVTYVFHLFVSWGVGVWGLDHLVPTRWEVTVQYETLVTPDEWVSFYILAIIMILESMFTVAQLVPYYRSRSVIQAGTGYYFFYTFVWQTAFTLFYSFELFLLSFISIMGTLISLIMLISSQEKHNSYSNTAGAYYHQQSNNNNNNNNSSSNNNIAALAGTSSTSNNQYNANNYYYYYGPTKHTMEYFLFRFPFYLHTGWMICLCSNHFSLLLRWMLATNTSTSSIGYQLMSDIVLLALQLPIATYSLTRYNPDFVIPLVVLLSYVGVGCRLCHPSDAIIELYGLIIIDAIRYTSFAFAGIVGCCLIPSCIVWFAREFCTIHVVELE